MCTDHIDDKLKLILLLNNSKFTITLDYILNNEVNLNVLIDNTTDSGLVYFNNSYNKMKIKDIANKTMDKLIKLLCKFKDDLIVPNKYNIDKKILENEINIACIKHEQYINDINIQNAVNKCISDIYNKKRIK